MTLEKEKFSPFDEEEDDEYDEDDDEGYYEFDEYDEDNEDEGYSYSQARLMIEEEELMREILENDVEL